MTADELKAKAELVVRSLTPERREAIKKGSPFKKERNAIIRKLAAQGVEYAVISEIGGVSVSSISRIALKKKAESIDSESLSFEEGVKRICQLLINLVGNKRAK